MRGLVLGVALFGAVGCGLDDGRPPVARIQTDPNAIPEHDNFESVITLDATASSDPIDDPAGTRPLEFEWDISGDEFRLEPGGGLTDSALAIRLRGSTPATIRLTVTDETGLTNTAERQIQLTVE